MALLSLTWRTGAHRRAPWAPWTALCLAMAWPAWAQPGAGGVEYAVKAAYLYKLAPFVEWPSAVFATPSSPLVLCVAGDDPFGETLDEAVQGQRIGPRPLVVRRMPTVEPGAACHILYAAGSKTQSAEAAVREVEGAPVLTVTDQSRGGAGGVVQFVVRDGRVRFDIDLGAAARNRMSISSKLLSLALSVRPKG